MAISKAPWRLSLPDDCLVLDESGDEICKTLGNYDADHERMEANARLIAAAPHLLVALKGLLSIYLDVANSGDCGNWPVEEDAGVIVSRAAIAKAEGK